MNVLTAAQMIQADKLARASGVSEMDLIRAAGKQVALQARELGAEQGKKIVACCGTGNNGADGYICAGHLLRAGYEVHILSLIGPEKLTHERVRAAKEVLDLLPPNAIHINPEDPTLVLSDAVLIIDALFGTGLSRAPTDKAARLITAMNAAKGTKIAVDIPSGLSADKAESLGTECVHAQTTVTFFRPKLVHHLEPGMSHCGQVHCVPIGIPTDVLDTIKPQYRLNGTDIFKLPIPQAQDHKYSRGHALIVAGEEFPGAAVLCTMATQRAGAGLTSLITAAEKANFMRQLLPASCIVRSAVNVEGIAHRLKGSAVLIGCGCGSEEKTARQTLQLLSESIPVVLDADALTSFKDQPDLLLQALTSRTAASILTPHLGEFYRLFPHLEESNPQGEKMRDLNKVEKAVAAAQRSQAVIVLKGADTIIASPDGTAVINPIASPYLAIGGSGDVLGGIILSLLAQGMTAPDAACAGVYIHSQAAEQVGINLIPEDLIAALPRIYAEILAEARIE